MPSFLVRDGVRLAYVDTHPDNVDRPSMVLVHGWCGDHTLMAAQAAAFRDTHRVVSVDLRGYGDSDAPKQEYTIEGFANDVAWLCEQLKLVKPVVIGHSMGGNTALQLAASHSHIPQAVILLDTVVFPAPELAAVIQKTVEALTPADYVAVANTLLKAVCLPTDAFGQRLQPSDSVHAPFHVVLSSLKAHTAPNYGGDAASACKLPIGYIASTKPVANLVEFQRVTPQLQVGTVMGAGHFAQVEDPTQVNAMIARFLHLLSAPKETDGSQ